MNIPLIDKSSYLRGLLILARKDNHISAIQKSIILEAGKQLGFSSSFCEEILNTLLYNECLCEEPVTFNNHSVAQSFVEDGLKLTCSGKSITDAELNWLRRSAKLNTVNMKWFEGKIKSCRCMMNYNIPVQLTLCSII